MKGVSIACVVLLAGCAADTNVAPGPLDVPEPQIVVEFAVICSDGLGRSVATHGGCGDEEAAIARVTRLRWPDGPDCVVVDDNALECRWPAEVAP